MLEKHVEKLNELLRDTIDQYTRKNDIRAIAKLNRAMGKIEIILYDIPTEENNE